MTTFVVILALFTGWAMSMIALADAAWGDIE